MLSIAKRSINSSISFSMIALFKLSKADSPNGFWKLSEEIFNRISDKSEHVSYLLANRDVAMRQNILFIN